MGSILGLLGAGDNIADDILKSILGSGGAGGSSASADPLASLFGGQDGIGSGGGGGGGGGGLSTLMNVASLAAMFL